jgi:hypothetical protein
MVTALPHLLSGIATAVLFPVTGHDRQPAPAGTPKRTRNSTSKPATAKGQSLTQCDCATALPAGARVWYNGQFHTVADPLRHLVDGLLSLTNPIGSVADKVNVGLFRFKTLLGPLDAIFEKPETTILERLRVRWGSSGEVCSDVGV